jgi:RNA polymerase sigma-70 factor (ECF subfamily)
MGDHEPEPDHAERSPSGSLRRPAEGERFVEALELQELVATAVSELPEEQREAVILKEYQGLTFPEIAEIQGVPISTVKTRLYRGLSVLRERLVRQGVHGAMEQEKAYAVQRP